MCASENDPGRNEKWMEQYARDEAERVSPPFSEALHLRVMRGVDSACLSSLTLHARSRPSIAPLMALAAALAVLVLPTLYERLNPARPLARNPIQSARIISSPTDSETSVFAMQHAAYQVNVGVQSMVQTAMVEQQWAGLDHDVRLAARYLVDQVPLKSAWTSDAASR